MALTAPLAAAGAVLLDLDGTLVRSEHVHRAAWQGFFEHWGVEVGADEYARVFMGRRARDVLGSVAGPWTGADVTASVAVLAQRSRELAGTVEVVPGAVDLLRTLAEGGRPVAVVTSAEAGWAGQVLDEVLGHAPPVVVTAEMVGEGKPSPEGYLLACHLLGVAPGACVAVEDSPSGIRSLVAAGVGTVVGITTTSDAAELIGAGAHRTVADLRLGAGPGTGSGPSPAPGISRRGRAGPAG